MERFLRLNMLDKRDWETSQEHIQRLERWLESPWECFVRSSRPASKHRVSQVKALIKTLRSRL
jgi:hypothetical protein